MLREYDELTLKKLQKTVLSIFKDFAEICEKNGFTYYGFAGSAIGAVRHGGFIPWDDDIDVAIPRKDFEKLVKIIERDYSDKYFIMSADKFDTYPLMTARLTLKGTRFQEYALKGSTAPLGIFLDVYPLDEAPDSEKERKRRERKAFIYSKLLILKHIPFPYVPFGGIKGKIAHAATATVWFLLNLFRVSHKFLYNKAYKTAVKYNGVESENYEWFFPQKLGNGFVKKADILPTVEFDFEDTKMRLMKEYDTNLKKDFGDYMTLPPVEKRKNHLPYKLKFPDSDEVLTEA